MGEADVKCSFNIWTRNPALLDEESGTKTVGIRSGSVRTEGLKRDACIGKRQIISSLTITHGMKNAAVGTWYPQDYIGQETYDDIINCYAFTAPRSHSWDERQNQPCVPTVTTSTGGKEKYYKSERTRKWIPHLVFNHLRSELWADCLHLQGYFSVTIVLQRDVDWPRSACTHMFSMRILGFSSFQNWFCAVWRFICLYRTWFKGWFMLYALLPLPFICFLSCLINAGLPVPKWCKLFGKRGAQTLRSSYLKC